MLERMLDSLLFWNIVSYIILFIAFVLIVYVLWDISKDVKKFLKNRKEKNRKEKNQKNKK